MELHKRISNAAVPLAALLVLLYCASFPFQSVLEIRSKDREGATTVIYYDTGGGWSEQATLRASLSPQQIYRAPFYLADLQGLRIDFSDSETPYTVERVLFFHRGKQILDITGNQLLEYFTPVNVGEMEQKYHYCIVTPENDDSHFVANEKTLAVLNAQKPLRLRWQGMWLALCAALCIVSVWLHRARLLAVARWLRDQLDQIIGGLLIAALCLTAFMAWSAPAHSGPDEWVTDYAVRYYETAWTLPDIRDPALSHTFSNYGSSRLDENTLYYFFAGKASALLRPVLDRVGFPSVRALNVLLFAHMALLALKKRNQLPWIVLIPLFTPQVWYLFSYATSDAFDFWLSFLAVLQVCNPGSALNRWIDQPEPVWKNSLPPALIFGLLLLAKPFYYVTLLACGAVLLVRWLRQEGKPAKTRMLCRCAVVTLGALLVLGIRWGADLTVYGLDKSAVSAQMAQVYQDPRLDDPAAILETPTQLELYQNGVTFSQLLWEKGLVRLLSNSFVGQYGWMELPSADWYAVLIYGLYGLLFVWMSVQILRKKDAWNALGLLLLLGCMALSLGLVIWQCWLRDFQPQGRYLFPCITAFGLCASMVAMDGWKTSLPKAFFFLIGILGTYSFVVWGILRISGSGLGIVL